MPAPDLTVADFRRYLQSLPPDEGAGRVGLPWDCPLARFIVAQGYAVASVGTADVCYYHDQNDMNGGYLVDTPPLLARFIWEVDGLGMPETPVTAREALAVLDEVEQPEKGVDV